MTGTGRVTGTERPGATIADTAPPSEPLAPTALEGLLARHARRVLAGLLVGAAFVRLLLVLQVAAGPLSRIHTFWTETDGHFFDTWGRRIAAGDLLQPGPWHPDVVWMRVVAQRAQELDPGLLGRAGIDRALPPAARSAALWDRWLGGATFFQEPGYPYLVGLTYRLAGPEPWAVVAWQLLLGVAGVVVVHRLALRLHSHTAAAAAGTLAVLAPVPLFLEVTLLRDALVAWLGLALALLMAWAVEGSRRRWFVLGLAFGAAALVKQTFLAFPVTMGLWRLCAVRSPWRERLAAGGLVVAGIALALSPAVLRNIAVGVQPLALNGSAAAMLPLYHTAGATPYGVAADLDYVRALVASDGRPLQALLAAARTHGGPWSLLALEAGKLAYAFHGFDVPNNVDFALFRLEAPVLALLPAVLVVLVPLAAIGVVGGGGRAWPVLVAVAGSLPALVLASVVGRYRASLTFALLPLAGIGVVQLATWLRGRRSVPLAIAAALSAAYLAWATGDPPGRDAARRADQYRRDGEFFAGIDRAYAALNFEESLRLHPGDTAVERRLAEVRQAARDVDAASGREGRAGPATGAADRAPETRDGAAGFGEDRP